MDTQMKKGLLELCLLCFINAKDRYGYELVEIASKYIQMNENTIYPILRRLTQKNILSTYLVDSDSGGPARKYFKLTPLGQKTLANGIKDWQEFSESINKIIKMNTERENNEK